MLEDVFSNKDKFFDFFELSVDNANDVADKCNFMVDGDGFKLPRFILPDGEDDVDLFMDKLISSGCERVFERDRIPESEQKNYWYRLESEVETIKKVKGYNGATGIDYFLVLWDILQFCKSEGILTGPGRGSAAGSLLSYVLGITKVNPITKGLMFERFLNEGRIGGSLDENVVEVVLSNGETRYYQPASTDIPVLNGKVKSKLGITRKVVSIEEKTIKKYLSGKLPDIDVDFQSSRIDDVKRYMRDKYGYDNVAYIGTANTFKVKSAFKDLARVFDVPPEKSNYFSKLVEDYMGRAGKNDLNMSVFFKLAIDNPQFYDFLQDNIEMFNLIPLILSQNASLSTHACAMLVLPSEDKAGNAANMHDFIPVRRDGDKIVTEWSGSELDDMGFLKEDILSLGQLDKFAIIYDELRKNGVDVSAYIDYDINYDDHHVMDIFRNGYLQDVFQFGGLRSYMSNLQPGSLDEIVAATALYRPGPMDSGAHEDFIKLKFGEIEPSYDVGCEDITKNTYGLLIYQEQIMAIVSKLGGLSLKDADTVRAGLGKKQLDKVKKFKDRFIEESTSKYGYLKAESEDLWHKIEAFASYSFNKSHAQCYTHIAYMCAYLKHYHPTEFYLASLTESNKDDVSAIIGEVNELGKIKVRPPCVNISTDRFVVLRGDIYWSLEKVDRVGAVCYSSIVSERSERGLFFSMDEFLDRVNKSKVNRGHVVNLVLAGAFDNVCGVEKPYQRFNVLRDYFKRRKEDFPHDDFPANQVGKDYFWEMRQKTITGFGYIDLAGVIKSVVELGKCKVLTDRNYANHHDTSQHYFFAGSVIDVIERKPRSGSGRNFGSMKVDMNGVVMPVTVWSDTWERYSQALKKSKGLMMVMNGVCKFDTYNGRNINSFYSCRDSEIIFV